MGMRLGRGLGLGKCSGAADGLTFADIGADDMIFWLTPEANDNPNLFDYSEDITPGGSWENSGGLLRTSGQDDPDGGTTAWLLDPNSTNSALEYNALPFPAGETFTFSAWIKAGPGHGGSSAALQLYDGVGATQTTFVPSATWQRVSVTRTLDAAPTRLRAQVKPDTGSPYTDKVYVAFLQCEVGSSAGTYHKTEGSPGGVVASWDDYFGVADYGQATAAYRPLVLPETLDGHNGVLFDRVDDYLDKTGDLQQATGAFELWMVMRVDIDGVNSIILADTSPVSQVVMTSTGSVQLAVGGATPTIAPAATLSDEELVALRISRDASDNIIIEKNGVDVTDGTPNQSGTYSVERLSYYSAINVGLKVGVEFAMIDRALTAAEATAIWTTWATKYPTLGIA